MTECAFVTRAFYRGMAVDQLQMHLFAGVGSSALSPYSPSQYATLENDSASSFSAETERYPTGANALLGNEPTYKIVTVCFDHEGNEPAPVSVVPVYDTGSVFSTFSIVKPAVAWHGASSRNPKQYYTAKRTCQ